MTALRHTRTGWWLEEATAAFGPVEPAPALDQRHARRRPRRRRRLPRHLDGLARSRSSSPTPTSWSLDAGLCGHGPSGRNGGFVYDALGRRCRRCASASATRAALAVCRASERAVRGIGAWCEAQDVDAWYRAGADAERRHAPTRRSVPGTTPSSRPAARSARPRRSRPSTRTRCGARVRSPLFRGGGCCSRRRRPSSRRGSRSGCAPRSSSAASGIHEHTRVRAARPGRAAPRRDGGHVRAGAAVLAVNARPPAFAGFRLALAVASSHIVLTEPVPDVLEELGWTGGESIVRQPHDAPLPAHDA